MYIRYAGVFLVGIIIGFLGGLFGKGGSAIATPMLSLIGIPGFVAIASPLPATIPGTLIASLEYRKSKLLDLKIVIWSIIAGIPASIAGSYLTDLTGSKPLLILTGLLVLGFGFSFLLYPHERSGPVDTEEHSGPVQSVTWHIKLVLVAVFVGLISGLLANSGGFLLAPSYSRFLGQPIKKAFACSLAVSMVLAIPGTIVHAFLGHIDWIVTLFLALGSVPLSYIGAKVAIHSKASRLERFYGILLALLGIVFLSKLWL
ncbi:MAG: sulfite exporter TauE/SafE family protein [Bacteroidales bacterium]